MDAELKKTSKRLNPAFCRFSAVLLLTGGLLTSSLLMGSLLVGCNSSGSSDVLPVKSVDKMSKAERHKYMNDHLIAVVAHLANRFSVEDLDYNQLKKVVDSFSMYLPIAVYQEETEIPKDVVAVGLFKNDDPLQAEVIQLALPQLVGTQLGFDELTNYFGPLQFQDPIFRKAKMLPPVQLDLDNYLKKADKFNPKRQVSLVISALNVPEAANNQINYVEIVKWKKK